MLFSAVIQALIIFKLRERYILLESLVALVNSQSHINQTLPCNSTIKKLVIIDQGSHKSSIRIRGPKFRGVGLAISRCISERLIFLLEIISKRQAKASIHQQPAVKTHHYKERSPCNWEPLR